MNEIDENLHQDVIDEQAVVGAVEPKNPPSDRLLDIPRATPEQLAEALDRTAAEVGVITLGDLAQVLSVADLRAILAAYAPPVTRRLPVGTAHVRGEVNLRLAAADRNIIRTLPAGTIVQIQDTPLKRLRFADQPDGRLWTWVFVHTTDGLYGWMAEELLHAGLPPAVLPIPARSKIGVAFLGTLSDAELGAAMGLGASVYKSIDNSDLLIQAYRANPSAVLVYRRYEGSDEDPVAFINRHRGPELAATVWCSQMQDLFAQMPWAWFESFNEPYPSAEYIASEAARVRRMAELGVRACVLNLGVGRTDMGFWMQARDLVNLVIEHRGVIGLHGYAQTVISANHGPSFFDEDGNWNGPLFPEVTERPTWTAFRCLQDAEILRNFGQAEARIVLTEFGLDDLVSGVESGIHGSKFGLTRGWKSCADVWEKHGWLKGTTAEAFYRQQLEYARQVLQSDPQIAGAALFYAGEQNDERWKPFDVRGVL